MYVHKEPLTRGNDSEVIIAIKAHGITGHALVNDVRQKIAEGAMSVY